MRKKYFVYILVVHNNDTMKFVSDTFNTVQEALEYKAYLEANLDKTKFIVNISETIDKIEMFEKLMETFKEANEDVESEEYNS